MKNQKVFLWSIVLFFGVSLFVLPAAQAKERGARESRKHKGLSSSTAILEKVGGEISLTDEQREQIKAIRGKVKGDKKEGYLVLKEKREALRELLDGENPTMVQAKALVDEISELQKQNMLKKVEQVVAIREILTAEQYIKLQEIKNKHKTKFIEKRKAMKKKRGLRFGEGEEKGWGKKRGFHDDEDVDSSAPDEG